MESWIKNYKGKFKDILDQLRDYCVYYYKERLLSLVVFGSVAKGIFSPVSDIDLLVVLKKKKGNSKEFLYYFENIEKKLDKRGLYLEINPIFKSREELSVDLPYLWNTTFVILFDRDNFFKKFTEELEKFKKQKLKVRDNYIEIKEEMVRLDEK
ncbi:MAG: nucleotidyltransferase domain-containing protein [Chitinispirillaceae bacterium]|nr:nucleotidyltransferase domain-containing protein [Chitinispirillaceae bacterium]